MKMFINSNQRYYRLIEKKLKLYLTLFGGVLIKGPRFVGKSTVSQFYAKQFLNLTKPNDLSLVKLGLSHLVNEKDLPVVIDEWQIYPNTITICKNIIDEKNQSGIFLLTGSIWFGFKDVLDPGIGRFGSVLLRSLNLYESQESLNLISLSDLFFHEKFETQITDKNIDLAKIIRIVCRGGFPKTINNTSDYQAINTNYIDNLLTFLKNTKELHFKKDNFMKIMQTLALSCGEIINWNKFLAKINESRIIKITKPTLLKYIQIAKDLYLIEELEVFNPNLASKERIVKSKKIYFCDPSLAIALTDFNENNFLFNLNPFGFYFENFVYKELISYADYFDAKLFYYKNQNGLEVDFIIKHKSGAFDAIEVKLDSSEDTINQAARNLIRYKKRCLSKQENAQMKNDRWNIHLYSTPNHLIVITGLGNIAYKKVIDKEIIYVVPITFLKP